MTHEPQREEYYVYFFIGYLGMANIMLDYALTEYKKTSNKICALHDYKTKLNWVQRDIKLKIRHIDDEAKKMFNQDTAEIIASIGHLLVQLREQNKLEIAEDFMEQLRIGEVMVDGNQQLYDSIIDANYSNYPKFEITITKDKLKEILKIK